MEAAGPRNAVRTFLAAIRMCDAVPNRRIQKTGERRKIRQHCLADSSAPASTLAAKPMAAYHFIAFGAERQRT
jgi:hypothetical protein